MENDMSNVYAALGWAWSKACSMLDEGKDPREYEIPKLIEEFKEMVNGQS